MDIGLVRAGQPGQALQMSLTRRDATKLVLAGPALAAGAGPAAAFLHRRRAPDDWPSRLQAELDAHLMPDCDGKLTLKAFDMARPGGRVQMAAVIQLDWPPGLRRRLFNAFGDEEDAAFQALLNQALFSFAKAWPGCVV